MDIQSREADMMAQFLNMNSLFETEKNNQEVTNKFVPTNPKLNLGIPVKLQICHVPTVCPILVVILPLQ